MFVLSFFLHSILFAGSALDNFQCLRSLLIVSFHVFFGLPPRPRCPTTSNSVMLLIQPSFLTTCPIQRSRLYHNKVCMLLIPSFLRRESELMWSFKRTLHVHRIIARSLRCSLSRSLTLGAQYPLAYNKTMRIYVLYICPRVMYERAREVNIGKSSRNLHHVDRILVITFKSQLCVMFCFYFTSTVVDAEVLLFFFLLFSLYVIYIHVIFRERVIFC